VSPEFIAEMLAKKPVPAGMRGPLLRHLEGMTSIDMMQVARAWYDRDPDSFEAFIKPLPAPLRAALRDSLHRDFLSRYVYK
jgi:hypothetical protein